MQRNTGKNRKGKTRDHFKKISNSKGSLHANMGTIKYRNGKGLTEAERLRRGGKNTLNNCIKQVLMTWKNHDAVITHLEPDVLECEVKWTLGSLTTNKARGGGGIPADLFQILKVVAVKVLYSVHQWIWKTQQWPQVWKSCFYFNPKGNDKECSNYRTFSQVSKVLL